MSLSFGQHKTGHIPGVDHRLPDLLRAVAQLPVDMHPMFAQLIQLVAKHIRDVQNREFEVSNLGPERVVLYHSLKQQWPWLSESPVLAKSIKTALLLDEMGQAALCSKIEDAVQLVAFYVRCCNELQQLCELQHVHLIIETCVNQGGQKAGQVLKQVLAKKSELPTLEPS